MAGGEGKQGWPHLRDVVTFAQDPGDDIRTRDLKAMSTMVLLFIAAMTILYFIVPERSTLLKGYDVAVFVLQLYGLAVLYLSRSVSTLFHAYIPLYILIIGSVVLINGTAEGDFVGLISVPCAAVAILGPHRSIPWFLICLAAVLLIPEIDAMLPRITLEAAVSPVNPEGLLFDSPAKKPIGRVEAIAYGAIVTVIYFMFRSFYMQLDTAKVAVESEKAKVDRLMGAVFPSSIAERLKQDGEAVIAQHHAEATILFADIVNFTPLAARLSASEVVAHLDSVFALVDRLARTHGVEKIKTIGDAYMAVAGLPDPMPDHATRMADFALALRDGVGALRRDNGAPVLLRIGLNAGPVVAGVIGRSKPFYDVWGDTVNLAARLESHGAPGRIQVTEAFAERLGTDYRFSPLHELELKGIGIVRCRYLEDRVPPHSHQRSTSAMSSSDQPK